MLLTFPLYRAPLRISLNHLDPERRYNNWNVVVLPHPASQASAPLSRVPGEGKFENDLIV